jgi:dihydroxyacid dehydratase/phosphogluconate dehydratase
MSFYFYFFFCLLAYRTHQAVQPLGSTSVSKEEFAEIERSVVSTLGSCAGMATANSMSCLVEVFFGAKRNYPGFAHLNDPT